MHKGNEKFPVFTYIPTDSELRTERELENERLFIHHANSFERQAIFQVLSCRKKTPNL